jgi:hypothetical protein
MPETSSCFQEGVRFPDNSLQTTAATTTPPTTPAGPSGSIQFNNGGVFGGETNLTLSSAAPVVAAGQIGLGSTTDITATTGTNG